MFCKCRQSKKKTLIDLPFRKKERKNISPSKVEKAKISEEVKAEVKNQETTQPTTIKQPLNLSNKLAFGDAISIKKTDKPKQNTETTSIDPLNKANTHFTQEEFTSKWNKFKNNLLNDGKSSLASVFENTPLIEDTLITVTLENKALEDEFISQKNIILDFLRKELNNFSISIETVINKDTVTKKAYTPQEKFMKMGEKNPALINLAKSFDAEVGYPLD